MDRRNAAMLCCKGPRRGKREKAPRRSDAGLCREVDAAAFEAFLAASSELLDVEDDAVSPVLELMPVFESFFGGCAAWQTLGCAGLWCSAE